MLALPAFASPSPWAESEVSSAKSSGLVPKSIDADYQNAITRVEFCEAVMLLYSSLGGADVSVQNPFEDTDLSYVTSAYGAGIVYGVSETLFAPASFITREEICTMLKRCISASGAPAYVSPSFPNFFPDGDAISDWAYDSVQYMNMMEIMLGDEHGNISPKANTTREQAILLIYRLYNAVRPKDLSALELYGFYTSGNTTSNMKNGAFAIKNLRGELVLSDNSGIYALSSKSYASHDAARTIFADNEICTYINAADGFIYEASYGGTPSLKVSEKCDSFALAGSTLVFRTADTHVIKSLANATGETTALTGEGCSTPILSGNYLIYSDSEGIKRVNIKTLESETVYSGEVSGLVYENNSLYYKEGNNLCKMSASDFSRSVIISFDFDDFYISSDTAILVKNGTLYKCSISKGYIICMGNYPDCGLNINGADLYLKDSAGIISKVNIKTLEKIQLN